MRPSVASPQVDELQAIGGERSRCQSQAETLLLSAHVMDDRPQHKHFRVCWVEDFWLLTQDAARAAH